MYREAAVLNLQIIAGYVNKKTAVFKNTAVNIMGLIWDCTTKGNMASYLVLSSGSLVICFLI